jgi:hypothetical protein
MIQEEKEKRARSQEFPLAAVERDKEENGNISC